MFSHDTQDCPPPKPWGSKDWIICGLLFLTAFSLYGFWRNVEIQGDDDYLYPANFSLITDAFLNFRAGSVKELTSSIVTLAGQTLCAPRHAPLPAFAHAVFYAISHKCGIPFTINLMHLPSAGVSALSVALLYGLLRRNDPSRRVLSITGALLLLLSPVFTLSSRGMATYHLVFVLCSTLVSLWSLDSLHRNGRPRWWIGIGLAQGVISDVIWFITLPVLLGASIWAASDRKRALSRLASFQVVGPVALTAGTLILGTWLAYRSGISTPLAKLLTDHGTKISKGVPIIMSPSYLLESVPLLMGIAFPIIFIAGLIFWRVSRQRLSWGLLTAFGWIGILVYGTVFYALSPERHWIKLCYQLYLLLPFIAITIALLKMVSNRNAKNPATLSLIIVSLLLFEGLACVNFIWKVRVSPFPCIFEDTEHGTVNPNQGTKAAGYLFRRWAETVWTKSPKQPVIVYASGYNMSFAIFSGINAAEKGGGFYAKFGPGRPIKVLRAPKVLEIAGLQQSKIASYAYVFDLSGSPAESNVADTLVHAPSQFLRYTIRPSSSRNAATVVFVRPPEGSLPPLPQGDYSMAHLESLYDRDYHSYYDFFPNSLER